MLKCQFVKYTSIKLKKTNKNQNIKNGIVLTKGMRNCDIEQASRKHKLSHYEERIINLERRKLWSERKHHKPDKT